jgi:hypothetical protein
MRFACALLSLVTVLFVAGCALSSGDNRAPVVDRTRPPVDYEKSINTFFDVRIKGSRKNRELSIGKPQPGGCPLGGHSSSERGWVVPVLYTTRSGSLTDKAGIQINSKEQYFWFREDTIYGVTPRMELCP